MKSDNLTQITKRYGEMVLTGFRAIWPESTRDEGNELVAATDAVSTSTGSGTFGTKGAVESKSED